MSIEDLIDRLDSRFERWELRRYTQEFDEGRVKDRLYTVALPYGTEPDDDGVHRTMLRDYGYAADPAMAIERALQEYPDASYRSTRCPGV